MAQKRCLPPEVFTVDGRSLGFLDGYGIDWVRPGMNVGPCSTSYLLADDLGALYIVQSAHCVRTAEVGTHCTDSYPPLGTTFEIERYEERATLVWSSGHHMGTYASTADECGYWDMAILRLPDSLRPRIHPAIRHIGGPTGLQDPLLARHRDAIVGYGNSDDRGLLVEALTGNDHGNAPLWPIVNVFRGYFVGNWMDDFSCAANPSECWNQLPYKDAFGAYLRYNVTKITGDSGSSDLMAGGKALGITSALDPFTATGVSTVLYDSLLRIWFDAGVRYRLVTWAEWSPDTIET